MSKPLVLSIVMPVRNEGLNLQVMMKMLDAVVDVPHEVVVVVDGPDDSSVPVVELLRNQYASLRLVENSAGRGVLQALRTGVAESRGENVLIFAADEVGPVLAIDDMLALIGEGCEFVSCTRYANGGRRLGGSWVGGALSRLANALFCTLGGSRLSDATTGIKMFRRQVFETLSLEARPVGWAVAFEMGIKAQLLGLRLGEVPIVSIDRLFGGTSTFRVGPWTVEYLRWFVWGVWRLRTSSVDTSPARIRIPLATASQAGVRREGAA